MSTVTIIIEDFTNCSVVGLIDHHINILYERFGFYATNYRFSPKYQLGVWDGKIRFFSKNGTTYVNLLDQIVPLLVKWKYKVSINDKRNHYISNTAVQPITSDFFSHLTKNGKPWKFRDYQIELVNTLLANGNGIAVAATGSGKTAMTAAITKAYELANNLKTIIIVPDKSLNKQTFMEYKLFGLDVGNYSGDVKDLNHQHIVATWQALQNNPSLISRFDVIIVDEAHGLRGHVLKKLLTVNGRNVPFRFGVTGTMPKEMADYTSVITAIGPILYEIPAHVLINQGNLAKIHINIKQIEADLHEEYNAYLEETPFDPITYTKFKNSFFPEWSAEKKYLQQNKARMRWISEFLETLNAQEKGNVLCLINGINFGKQLTKQTQNAVFLHGKDKTEDRKAIYDMFEKENNMLVIANAQIAAVGLDIPRIFHLVFIDMGRSFVRVIQSIGRGLRVAEDKKEIQVYDIGSDLPFSRRQLHKRIKYYQEAKYPYTKDKIKLVD